jgi:hypothetical protein
MLGLVCVCVRVRVRVRVCKVCKMIFMFMFILATDLEMYCASCEVRTDFIYVM